MVVILAVQTKGRGFSLRNLRLLVDGACWALALPAPAPADLRRWSQPVYSYACLSLYL